MFTLLSNTTKKELSIKSWKRIIDILKTKKTIYLTFTGGEIFCRKEFIDPYGNIYLCESSMNNCWNLLQHTFEYCWNKIYIERKKEIDNTIPCNVYGCKYKEYCSACLPNIKKEYGKWCIPKGMCHSAEKLYLLANKREC
jgi:hypothetical protein